MLSRDNAVLARSIIGLASLALATAGPIALIWIGLDNVITWKILGTVAMLLCAAAILVAVDSRSAPQVGVSTPVPTSSPGVGPTPQPPTNDGGPVTYVFDRDLVRFLKFAGSVLAVFLIAGAFLFGIDLKKTVETVQKSKEDSQTALHGSQESVLTIKGTKTDIAQLVKESKDSSEEIKKARESALESEQAARRAQGEVKKQLETAQALVNEIRGSRTRAQTIVESLGKPPPESARLSPEQVERLVEIKLLKSLRTTLPPDQFAKLEEQFKSNVKLRREIYDAQRGTNLPGKLVRSEGEPATKDSVVTEVYNNIGTVHQFFKSVFERDLSADTGGPVRATVHYDLQYNNTFWDGSQLVFGDGDGVLFKTDGLASLTIVAAELSHPVIQFSANLEYRDQPGALHTHFTNVFAVLTEQWEKKQTVDEASWLVGAGALAPKVKGVALRSVKAPGTAYDDPKLGGKDPQPDHMKNYVKTTNDLGGVHINSGIPDRAFYETAKALGGNAWEKPGTIWYKSLLRLKADSNFEDCARTTYEVAGELYGKASKEQEAVKSGWQKVGIEIKQAKKP